MALALKEWAVLCEGLEQGSLSLLLRKGGIREQKGRFEVPVDRFWLLPTHEHQRPELLREPWRSACQAMLERSPDAPYGPAAPGAPAAARARLRLSGWAQIQGVHRIDEPEALERIADLHPFAPDYAVRRLHWKARQPLWILLVRAYRLGSPLEVPWLPSHDGCKSWVELGEEVPPPAGGSAVLDDHGAAARAAVLEARLGLPEGARQAWTGVED